tara:strand:+ start:225 stop:899 length:675 start_codon:yes stop_codon:yes gene_type:complete
MVTKTSLPLFPIPVCLYNYGEDESHGLNIDLVTDTISEMYKDQEGTQRSNFGGWHSKGDLEVRYSSFNVLKNKIQESVNDYCDRYGFQKDGLVVSKLWANMNYTGDMNVGHHHATTALTGVYYPVKHIIDKSCEFNYSEGNPLQPGIWDGERGGSIYFQDPSYGLKSRLRKVKEPTAYNLDAYYTYPVSGLLIVFPSYLIHTVTPFKENLQRLSISFTANYGTS